MQRHPVLGVALVLAAASLWGTTGTARSLSGGTLDAAWFGALRLLVAAAFYALAAAALRPAGAANGTRTPWLALLAAGACMAAYNLAFFAGIASAGVGLGTAMALGSAPVWAGLLEALLLRRAPGRAWWLGSALAVAGGVLMSLAGGGAGATSPGARAGGIGLCLLAGAAYAGYALINKQLAARVPAQRFTLVAFGAAALVALPGAALLSGPPKGSLGDLPALLWVGVVTSGVAYLLLSQALRHVSAATCVTLSLMEPVVAFTLAVLLLGEAAGAQALIGLVLVVGGVLAVARAELAAPKPAAGTSA
jgi:DME family drug/metabolite transporter